MTTNSTHETDEVVVARVRDRTYRVPRRIVEVLHVEAPDGEPMHVTITVEVVDGLPSLRAFDVTAYGRPLTPQEVGRLPWAVYTRTAVEAAAGRVQGADPEARRALRSELEAEGRREHDRRRQRQSGGRRQYRRSDDDLMATIVVLRDEARALAIPMHLHIAKKLNYDPGYARRLSATAAKWAASR